MVVQMVSTYQYQSSTPCCLPHNNINVSSTLNYIDWTLVVEYCFKFIFIFNHTSLGAGETLIGKHAFESRLYSFGFSVWFCHGDNGIFASQAFKDDVLKKE